MNVEKIQSQDSEGSWFVGFRPAYDELEPKIATARTTSRSFLIVLQVRLFRNGCQVIAQEKTGRGPSKSTAKFLPAMASMRNLVQ
jgi:hypothetical protein